MNKTRRGTMKKTHEILQVIRTQIMSEIFQVTHRVNTTDFCRKYLLTFPILIVFILNLVRRSLQAELNKFTNIIDFSFISKQVFSSARKKIKPKAFVELNKTLINQFYTDNQVPLFMRFRLLVVDGSTYSYLKAILLGKNMDFVRINQVKCLWREFHLLTIPFWINSKCNYALILPRKKPWPLTI